MAKAVSMFLSFWFLCLKLFDVVYMFLVSGFKNRAMARLFAMFRRFVETLRATSVRNG